MTLLDKIRGILPTNAPANAGNSLQGLVGVGSAPSFTDARYKAIIPAFLYKPPFGYPLAKNIPEIRRLARSPFVAMIVNTAIAEVSSIDWDIITEEGEKVPDEIIKKTKDFFKNPNRNNESMKFIIEAVVRDIMEIDAGVIVKVLDGKRDLVEIYARDGGLFNKNPDIYGVMPSVESGTPAYYQYGWLTGARPIPFLQDEIVYMIDHPRTDSIYGLSNVEILENVIQLLVYGVDSNLEYFSDNQIPKGVLSMVGATTDDIKAFQEIWAESMKKKGSDGKWRKDFHKMPIMNTDGEFKQIGFSNVELELIQQQEWFTKLVWAVYRITPSELGFTENSNKATESGQNVVVKRKLIAPLISLLEYHFNTEIVNFLPWVIGKYEDKVLFEFDKFDMVEEIRKVGLYIQELNAGLKTVNEIRKLRNDTPLPGGDIPKGVMLTGDSTGSIMNNYNKLDSTSSIMNKKPVEKVEKSSEENGVKKKVDVKALMSSTVLTLKEFEVIADKNLSDLEKIVLDLTRKEMTGFVNIKAMDSSFIKTLVASLSLNNIKSSVAGFIKESFFKGLGKVEVSVNVGVNVMPDYDAMRFLADYTFDNVKGLEDDLKNDLRQVLQRGLVDQKPYGELAKDISKVFDVSKVRALAIARTEEQRAIVQGELRGYQQLGIPMTKTWLATVDAKTSPVCRALNGVTVDLNDVFVYKGQSFSGPTAHVNCRSSLTYEVKK